MRAAAALATDSFLPSRLRHSFSTTVNALAGLEEDRANGAVPGDITTSALADAAAQRTNTPSPQLLPRKRDSKAPDCSYAKVLLHDGGVSRELRRSLRTPKWEVSYLEDTGHFVAREQGCGSAQWQMRAPPALSALLATGTCSKAEFWQRAIAKPPERLPAPVVILWLAAGRAALGVLREDCACPLQGGKKSVGALREHKVITTYAVRGGEKQGTGRFQLFEDQRKKGNGGTSRSDGAKLRRRLAFRFFEKINEKLMSWSSEKAGGAWPPMAIFFAGDARLRRYLLDCKHPRCPLPDDKVSWIALPGWLTQERPSLEALKQTARYLCTAEVIRMSDLTPEAADDEGRQTPEGRSEDHQKTPDSG